MAEIVEDNPVIQQTTIAVRDLPDQNKAENKEENNNMIPFATSTGINEKAIDTTNLPDENKTENNIIPFATSTGINDNEGNIESNSTPIGL